MSSKIPFPEMSITQHSNEDPQQLLLEALRVLILHHSAQGLCPDLHSPQDWPSIFLIASQYVSGEKSVKKSSMRLNLRISPDEADHPAAETFTLQLSVERQKSC